MTNAWTDDDRLFAALKDAVQTAEEVPPEFVAAAKAAYAWRTIDAELAQLSYDSLDDEQSRLVTRTENATVRALTFVSNRLTIELEVTAESVLGQVVPAQPGRLFMHSATGRTTTIDIDEIGCFTIQPVPAGPFRLHSRTDDGTDVLTSWITI